MTNPIQARFTEITVRAANGATVVQFTLEGRDGKSATFEQHNFKDFVSRAVALVMPGCNPRNTDELLNIWFDLESVT